MLSTEIRRTPMAPLALVLMVLGCWQALYSVEPVWLGRAQDTEIVFGAFSSLIVGPVAMAVSAWTVHRADRAGFGDVVRLGERPALAKLAVPAAAVWAWAALASSGALAAAAFRTWSFSGATPSVWLLLLPLAVLVVQVALGALAAAVFGRSLLVSIITPVVFYLAYFLHVSEQMATPGWRRLLPVLQEVWDPLYLLDVWRTLAALTFLVAASATVLWLSAQVTYRVVDTRRLAGVAVLAALVSGGLLWWAPPASSSSFYGAARQGASYVCRSSGDVRVCVWPPDAPLLPRLISALVAAVGPDPTADGLPRTVVEEGIQPPDAAPSADGTVVLSPPSLVASDLDVRAAVLTSLGPVDTGCIARGTPTLVASAFPAQFFARILGDRLGVSTPYTMDEDVVRAFTSLPVEKQDGWLGSARSAMSRCRDVPDLPVDGR